MTKTSERIKSVGMDRLVQNKLALDMYIEEIRKYLVEEKWTKEAIENAMKVPFAVPEKIFKINWVNK